jgi:hypothetical protein
MQLGGQIFKGHADTEDEKYRYLSVKADNDKNVPEPIVTGTVTPENRDILKYAPRWTTWPDFEQVRWLNSIIEWLWPHLAKGITKMVRLAAASFARGLRWHHSCPGLHAVSSLSASSSVESALLCIEAAGLHILGRPSSLLVRSDPQKNPGPDPDKM